MRPAYIASMVILATLVASTSLAKPRLKRPAPPPRVEGAFYYLSPTGRDDGPGALRQPWRTLAYAAGRMKPGDTTYLRAGSYVSNRPIFLRASGTMAAPLTFAAYQGETPTIKLDLVKPGDLDWQATLQIYGSYIVFDHLRMTNLNDDGQVMWIEYGAQHVTVSNCEVFGSGGSGILVSGNHNAVLKNDIHDNGNPVRGPLDHGIYVEGENNTVSENRLYNNVTFGIVLNNEGTRNKGGGNIIERNYVYHNGYRLAARNPAWPNGGIYVGNGTPNDIIRYNVSCDNNMYGFEIDGPPPPPGTRLVENVSCYNHGGGINACQAGPGITITGNISYNDQPFALCLPAGKWNSDKNIFFTTSGKPTIWWGYQQLDLAGFSAASGADKNSSIQDPRFTNLPRERFDWSAAHRYNFANPLNPALATPAK